MFGFRFNDNYTKPSARRWFKTIAIYKRAHHKTGTANWWCHAMNDKLYGMYVQADPFPLRSTCWHVFANHLQPIQYRVYCLIIRETHLMIWHIYGSIIICYTPTQYAHTSCFKFVLFPSASIFQLCFIAYKLYDHSRRLTPPCVHKFSMLKSRSESIKKTRIRMVYPTSIRQLLTQYCNREQRRRQAVSCSRDSVLTDSELPA